jgi:hypothetical protein
MCVMNAVRVGIPLGFGREENKSDRSIAAAGLVPRDDQRAIILVCASCLTRWSWPKTWFAVLVGSLSFVIPKLVPASIQR